MTRILGPQEILKYLPHRYPMLLVDRITIHEGGKSAIGIKNVTHNEPHFTGHFPDKPIMPGVLIIEAMAQAAGIMYTAHNEVEGKNELVYFMSIDNAKFRKPVVPGDTLELHVNTLKERSNIVKVSAIGKVGEEKVAEAEVTIMLVDRDKSNKL